MQFKYFLYPTIHHGSYSFWSKSVFCPGKNLVKDFYVFNKLFCSVCHLDSCPAGWQEFEIHNSSVFVDDVWLPTIPFHSTGVHYRAARQILISGRVEAFPTTVLGFRECNRERANLVPVPWEAASREVSDVNFAASGLFDFIVHHLTDKNEVVLRTCCLLEVLVETVKSRPLHLAGRADFRTTSYYVFFIDIFV